MSAAGSTPALLRLCLDLNVWVADFLGTRRERRGGSSPWLADAVRAGASQAGQLQLVVSLGMLDRLAIVLKREFQVEPDAAETLVTRSAAWPLSGRPVITRTRSLAAMYFHAR